MEGNSDYPGFRWKPRDVHIQRLKEEYCNRNGKVPSMKEACDLAQQLRQYGPVEPQNIRLWFKNQKRRENSKATSATTPTASGTNLVPVLVMYAPTTQAAVVTPTLFADSRSINLSTTITSSSKPPISINTVGAVNQSHLNNHIHRIQNTIDCWRWYSNPCLAEGTTNREQASSSARPRYLPIEEHPMQTVAGVLSLFPVRIHDVTHGNKGSTNKKNVAGGSMAQDVDLGLRVGSNRIAVNHGLVLGSPLFDVTEDQANMGIDLSLRLGPLGFE